MSLLGNFIGGEFTWTNTDKSLSLTTGAGLTTYVIEEYSNSAFIFNITFKQVMCKFDKDYGQGIANHPILKKK